MSLSYVYWTWQRPRFNRIDVTNTLAGRQSTPHCAIEQIIIIILIQDDQDATRVISFEYTKSVHLCVNTFMYKTYNSG